MYTLTFVQILCLVARYGIKWFSNQNQAPEDTWGVSYFLREFIVDEWGGHCGQHIRKSSSPTVHQSLNVLQPGNNKSFLVNLCASVDHVAGLGLWCF